MRFGTPVTALLKEDGRIVGMRTRADEFRAPPVLSAEGVLCRFAEEAGLYEGIRAPKRCAPLAVSVIDGMVYSGFPEGGPRVSSHRCRAAACSSGGSCPT